MPLFDQLMAVLFVLGLLVALLWVVRRRRLPGFGVLGHKRQADALLTVVERVPLTAQHTLHLVRLGSDTLLVATFPGGARFAPREAGFTQVFRAVPSQEQPQ